MSQLTNKSITNIKRICLTLSPGDPDGPSCPEAPYENVSGRKNMEVVMDLTGKFTHQQ